LVECFIGKIKHFRRRWWLSLAVATLVALWAVSAVRTYNVHYGVPVNVWDAVRGVKIVELQFNQYYPANITWAADNAKLALAARNRVYIWEGGHNWSSTLLEIDHSHRFEQVVWSANGREK